MKHYSIYCDGSTRGNGTSNAVGAWAFCVVETATQKLVHSDVAVECNTTNQRMELTAAIKALEWVEYAISGNPVAIYSDSAYLLNCIKQMWWIKWERNGWVNSKKEPVANKDLWMQLTPSFTIFGIDFIKVKGHTAGATIHEKWNNYVDDLAQTASAAYKNIIQGE